MGELTGKNALVTGASRGIGRAIAEVFVREGARVAICGRERETLETVAAGSNGAMVPVVCHVGRLADIERLATSVGPIDILVNNAATNIAQGPALTFTEVQFDKMVEVNLKSAFRLIQRIAPGMCERGSGSIINIASVSGMHPQFESMLYSMTKAALIMMTRSYAQELGPKGVRVNAIAPGLIETKLSEYFWKDAEHAKWFTARQAIPRTGQPSDVAEIAVMLACDRTSWMTGQTIVIDGGFTGC